MNDFAVWRPEVDELRILLVVNTLPPVDVSGVGEQVLQLAAGLRQAGHEVEVLGRGADGARGPKLLFPITVVPAVARCLARFRPHVVQVHESDGALAALLVATVRSLRHPCPRLLALLQVSYMEEFRAIRPLRFQGRVIGRPGVRELLFKWLKAPLQIVLGSLTAWLADQVLAPSRRTADEVIRDYGVEPVEVLPNVSGGLVVASEAEGGTPAATGALLFVGRLRLRKGLEVLLEAMAVDGGDEASTPRLLVAGDGEHRQRLETLCRRLRLSGRVEFLGRCSATQVRGMLARARALVVPSIYEGMPLVILEAMQGSCPVIASAVSGIPEVVIDGETGWLVPPEDVEALAAAIAVVWTDSEEAERRGRAGAKRVAEAFDPVSGARRWLSLVAAGRAKVGAA